ncbi:hypothetical protein ACQEVZ_08615 [Dactylosporangium sp. CA-152071]|uniref:hypothetical protein n=1 Tax=Dactylosporangium sp. CA-152071 TaxID=3239933 RepID=UPI003D94CBCD
MTTKEPALKRLATIATAVLLAVSAGCADDPAGGRSEAGAPQDVCGPIERLQPDEVLGGAPAGHRPCAADSTAGMLGVAVWTAADGRRVSVGVAGGTHAATFEQLYAAAPEPQRCTAGGGVRCVDKTSTGQAETGTLIVERGSTYLVVWLSDTGGHQAGLDVPAERRPAFLRLAAAAMRSVYGTEVHFPDTAAGRSPAGNTAAPTGTGTGGAGSADPVVAELGKLGYQRTMTGGYQSPQLGRKVTIEDWKPASGAGPTVQLSDAPPGRPGALAVADVDWGQVGQYQRFLCEPDDATAFKVARSIDLSRIVKDNVTNGVIQPQPGPSGSRTVAGNGVTCTAR